MILNCPSNILHVLKNVGKVKVISPEYRELLMDMLERGVLSDRMYDKLVDEEKQHFNQAVKASGLMENH